MNEPCVRTRLLAGDDWATWRELRLRSLAESPSAFGSTYEHELGFTERTWRDRLDDPGQVALVVEDDAGPVGMGAAYQDGPGMLHVVAMWVDPASRGLGVAHEVLAAIEAWASARDLRLHLDVATTNDAARRSYQRYGFEATGRTRLLREGSTHRTEEWVLRDRRTTGTPGSR